MPVFDVSALKDNFSKAAGAYEKHAHLQRAVREHAIALGQNYWKRNECLLDIGCGTGAFAHEAALLKCRWNITSLDVAHGMCRVAHTHTPMVINANAHSIPCADGSFDGIFSSLMLQWIDAPRGVFSEMARVLKPGGIGVLSTLVQGTLCELAAAFRALDDKPHISPFLHPHDLLAQAQQSGFALELAKQTSYVEHHADTIALMRGLQAIGATNTAHGRKRGLATPSQFTRLEQAYRNACATPQGLPATWQVLYLVLRKA